MQLHNLITITGLALSHVQAALPVFKAIKDDDPNALMARKVVTLIADPGQALESIPEFKMFAPHLKEHFPIYRTQMIEGQHQIFTTLRDLHDQKWPLVHQSLIGFYTTHDPVRARIYRNSMFSRIYDLSLTYPDQFPSHIHAAYNSLLLSLEHQASKLLNQHLLPMGSKEELDKFTKLIIDLQTKNQAKLRQYHQAFVDAIPPIPSDEAKYLTEDEVNKALEETNLNSEDKAMLVAIKSLPENHAPPKSKVPAPQTRPSPAFAAHVAQPVAVSA